MRHTRAENTLDAECGRDELLPGEFIKIQADPVLASEIPSVLAAASTIMGCTASPAVILA
ncbi:MAG: hypothetical protein ACE5NC_02600 [Anaerolineae bacterium]